MPEQNYQLWPNARGSMTLEADLTITSNNALVDLLHSAFEKRDRVFNPPKHQRMRKEDSTVLLEFTQREFAEATGADYPCARVVEWMKHMMGTVPEGGEEISFRYLELCEQQFQYGFVLREKAHTNGAPGKGHNFWRIFTPGMTQEEVATRIPKYFWSKSINGGLDEQQNFSPLFKQSKARVIHTDDDLPADSYKVRVREFFTLQLERFNRVINDVDCMRVYCTPLQHPPLIIFDNHDEKNALPMENLNLSERVQAVHNLYARFNGNELPT